RTKRTGALPICWSARKCCQHCSDGTVRSSAPEKISVGVVTLSIEKIGDFFTYVSGSRQGETFRYERSKQTPNSHVPKSLVQFTSPAPAHAHAKRSVRWVSAVARIEPLLHPTSASRFGSTSPFATRWSTPAIRSGTSRS